MGHILRSGGTLWLEPYQLSFRVHWWYFKSLSRHSVSMWPKVLILSMPMAQQWIFSWNPSFLFLSLLVETRLKDNPHWIAEVSDTHVGNPELLWVSRFQSLVWSFLHGLSTVTVWTKAHAAVRCASLVCRVQGKLHQWTNEFTHYFLNARSSAFEQNTTAVFTSSSLPHA